MSKRYRPAASVIVGGISRHAATAPPPIARATQPDPDSTVTQPIPRETLAEVGERWLSEIRGR